MKEMPAFPRPGFTAEQTESQEGLTYRQWLIGMALVGYNANPNRDDSSLKTEWCISDADEIIAALEKEGK